MPRIPLTSGAYQARSVIAGAQRCVNLYPESNPEDSQAPVPVTHYPTPGLVKVGQFPDASVVRGMYRATNGDVYAVCGSSVYFVASNTAGYALNFLGTIANGTKPISMRDNGLSIILVD